MSFLTKAGVSLGRFKGNALGFHKSPLARNSSWAFVGLAGNFALQAIYFLLMARLLGVREYGVFAGAFALVSAMTPYSSLGSQMIFMRYVSADRAMARVYWGNTLLLTAISSAFLAGGLALAGAKLFGSGMVGLIVVLVLANCLMSQIGANASSVFQTFEELKAMAWLRASTNFLRLLGIVGLSLFTYHATAYQCAIAILASSTLAAAIAVVWVRRSIGGAELDFRIAGKRLWEGIGFSFAGSTQAVYNDIDKMMLSHYGMIAANGIYSMAYRVVDFATTPVTAIDTACLPRYFYLHVDGLPAVLRLARKVVPIAVLSGLAAAGITLLASPLLVRIVGQGFAESLLAFRWLCILPALRGVHQLVGGGTYGNWPAELPHPGATAGSGVQFWPQSGMDSRAWLAGRCLGESRFRRCFDGVEHLPGHSVCDARG